MTLKDKIDALCQTFGKDAIKYARRGEYDRASWSDPDAYLIWHAFDRCPSYISYSDVGTDTPGGYDGTFTRAYVDLGNVARGEDAYGQTTTLDRSNFRSIMRDYPDMFTPTSYSNTDSLGAYVGNLTEDVISELCGLVTGYPVYDESDMSELESDEITESFDSYVRRDITCEIAESHRDTWEFLLTPDEQESAFWSAVTAADYYPEHDGHDVCWRYEDFMPQLLDAIETASANGYDTTFDHCEPASTFYRPPMF
jgi:hypothetical protein